MGFPHKSKGDILKVIGDSNYLVINSEKGKKRKSKRGKESRKGFLEEKSIKVNK